MAAIRRFDHIGITVADLDLVTDFFIALGLEVQGRTVVEGDFIDTVIGMAGARTEIVMLHAPAEAGSGTGIELSQFARPLAEPGMPTAAANVLGLRSVAFEVDDIEGLVARLAADGYGLVGAIGEYENAWRMAYVRGPEGILVALAQRVS